MNMMREGHPRKPRFKRAPDAPNFRLTPRDVELLRHVARYRFLRATQLAVLTGASHQVISRRLNLLFHHGYLDRPPEQLALIRLHGNQPIVYGVKGKSVGHLFMEHTLAVADFMVALECACAKQPGVRFIDQDEIISLAPPPTQKFHNPLYWPVTLYHQGKKHRLGVIPDRLFGIEIKNKNVPSRIGYFSLEADRGTMPITRQSFNQTSISRKLLVYAEIWRQGIHKKQLGIPRFRVVIVTTNAERAEHIIEACHRTSDGSKFFLVIDKPNLLINISILQTIFQTATNNFEQLMDGI